MMQRLQNLDSQTRTLIVGLGKTGLSCARYLAAQGVQVAITDSREEPPGLSVLMQHPPATAPANAGDPGPFGSIHARTRYWY